MYHRQALRNRAICDGADELAFGTQQRLGAEIERRARSANVVDQDHPNRRFASRPHPQAAAAEPIAPAKAALPARNRRFAPQRPLKRQHHELREFGREKIGMIKAALAKAKRAGGNGNQRGVGREGARRQCIDQLPRHQPCERRRRLELQCVYQHSRRPCELERRPMLLEPTAGTSWRQRLNPRQLRAAAFAESVSGRLAANPAERRNKQIERCTKHRANFGAPVESLPAAVCDDQA